MVWDVWQILVELPEWQVHAEPTVWVGLQSLALVAQTWEWRRSDLVPVVRSANLWLSGLVRSY